MTHPVKVVPKSIAMTSRSVGGILCRGMLYLMAKFGGCVERGVSGALCCVHESGGGNWWLLSRRRRPEDEIEIAVA